MRFIKGLSAAVFLAFCLATIPAQGALASPFHLEINNAVLDLGTVKAVRAIDSTITPPDPAATLDGSLTGNEIDVPKAGFVFQTKSTSVSGIPLKIDLTANEDITGKFDPDTGRMALDFDLKATVRATLGEDVTTCVISPIASTISTDKAYPYLGVRFTGGTSGPGAIAGSWEGLPEPTGGPICSVVGAVITGQGGIWMTHDLVDPKQCANEPTHTGCPGYEDPCETGDTAACCEQEPDHAGCKENHSTKLSVKVQPRSVKAKAGRKATFKVKVKNPGATRIYGAKLCAKAPRKLVKGARCFSGSIPAHGSFNRSFKFKLTRKAKGKIKVAFKVIAPALHPTMTKATIKVKRG